MERDALPLDWGQTPLPVTTLPSRVSCFRVAAARRTVQSFDDRFEAFRIRDARTLTLCDRRGAPRPRAVVVSPRTAAYGAIARGSDGALTF